MSETGPETVLSFSYFSGLFLSRSWVSGDQVLPICVAVRSLFSYQVLPCESDMLDPLPLAVRY
jgi:hypothetical protein